MAFMEYKAVQPKANKSLALFITSTLVLVVMAGARDVSHLDRVTVVMAGARDLSHLDRVTVVMAGA